MEEEPPKKWHQVCVCWVLEESIFQRCSGRNTHVNELKSGLTESQAAFMEQMGGLVVLVDNLSKETRSEKK